MMGLLRRMCRKSCLHQKSDRLSVSGFVKDLLLAAHLILAGRPQVLTCPSTSCLSLRAVAIIPLLLLQVLLIFYYRPLECLERVHVVLEAPSSAGSSVND